MQMMAKLALLSASFAALEATAQQTASGLGSRVDEVLRDQTLRECARAWAYAERVSPATQRFVVRMQNMEDALRLQCGLPGPSLAPSEIEPEDHRQFA